MPEKIMDLKVLNLEFEELIRQEQAAPNAKKLLPYTESERGIMTSIAAKIAVHLAARIERRFAELERQPFSYEGTHEGGKTYSRGSFVTHSGALWHANYTTAQRPGDGPAWTLAVKAGRDAR